MYLIDSEVPVTGFVSNSPEWKPNTSVFLMTSRWSSHSQATHRNQSWQQLSVGFVNPGLWQALHDGKWIISCFFFRFIDDIANCSICFLTSREVLVNLLLNNCWKLHAKFKPAQLQWCRWDILQLNHLLQIQWTKTTFNGPVWPPSRTYRISSLRAWKRSSSGISCCDIARRILFDGLLQLDKFNVLRSSDSKLGHDAVREHKVAIPQLKDLQGRFSPCCCCWPLFWRSLWSIIPMIVNNTAQRIDNIRLLLAKHAEVFGNWPAPCEQAFDSSSSKFSLPVINEVWNQLSNVAKLSRWCLDAIDHDTEMANFDHPLNLSSKQRHQLSFDFWLTTPACLAKHPAGKQSPPQPTANRQDKRRWSGHGKEFLSLNQFQWHQKLKTGFIQMKKRRLIRSTGDVALDNKNWIGLPKNLRQIWWSRICSARADAPKRISESKPIISATRMSGTGPMLFLCKTEESFHWFPAKLLEVTTKNNCMELRVSVERHCDLSKCRDALEVTSHPPSSKLSSINRWCFSKAGGCVWDCGIGHWRCAQFKSAILRIVFVMFKILVIYPEFAG